MAGERLELKGETVGWLRLAQLVLPIFVLSRLIPLVAVVITDVFPPPWTREFFSSTPVLQGMTPFDSFYFLGIARDGYHQLPVSGIHPDWVYFPAFPLLARIASIATLGNIALAGIVVANVALFIGLMLIYRIVAERDGSETAKWATRFVAFAPGAVAFGFAYSDSLLLMASAGALLAARHRRLWLVAAFFALATLSRPPGILLGLPLLIELWSAAGRKPSWSMLVLAVGPLSLGLFALYQGAVLGDPLAFIHGQASWRLPTLLEAPAGSDAVGRPLPGGPDPYIIAMAFILFALLLAYTAAIIPLIKSRLPRAEVALALMAFAGVFISGRIQSDARYLAGGWPFGWFFATTRPRVRTLLFGLSVVGYIGMTAINTLQLLAP